MRDARVTVQAANEAAAWGKAHVIFGAYFGKGVVWTVASSSGRPFVRRPDDTVVVWEVDFYAHSVDGAEEPRGRRE